MSASLPPVEPMPATADARSSRLLREADQCVKCGLCLPYCPTYRENQEEAEGPRGRIALMQGLALGELPPESVRSHLDSCLSCRACEAVCPAKVPYGRLVDLARAELGAEPRPGWLKLLLRTLQSRHGQRRLLRLLWAAQRLRLDRAAARLGILRLLGLDRAAAAASGLTNPRDWQPHYAAQGTPRGRVALFLGCVGNVLDQQTISAAIQVLTAIGFEVHVPADQACCGALPRHIGDHGAADAMAARNAGVFRGYDHIVYLASGCGAELLDHPLAAGAPEEICAFIHRHWPPSLTPAPLKQRVLVHEPCTLRNVVRQVAAPYQLLAQIPGLMVAPLPGNDRCCGAAGSYFLTQPTMADRLRAPKLREVAAAAPDLLATTNVGCALHLAAGLRADGRAVEVVHPVEILARQLDVR